ncbi:MAG TPA: ferritin-like domain-containing protein [Ilumatobacter sp.]|nr:ferritin-like domain-containing protein [Ilumatobacter sp.]
MTDSAVADHAASDRSSRRALLGAGVIGAALALTGTRSATAAATPGLSADDKSIATFAISLELAARDLYDAAIEAGSSDDLWGVLREQHEAYATRIAGLAGLSANTRNDDVYDSLVEAFSVAEPIEAAQELENVAAATHIGLLGEIEAPRFAEIAASVASMESRHSTVLGMVAGLSGDDLFLNPATPVEA